MFIDVMTEVRLFENNQIENKVFDLVIQASAIVFS